MRQLVVDIATSGLAPEEGHRIVEVAAVEMVDRKLTGKVFHRYLNPDRPIDPSIIQMTGLTTEFLSQQPRFAEVVETMEEYFRGAELLIHDAPFDLAFLSAELRRADSSPLRVSFGRIVDTLSLAERLHPGESHSLESLCQRYGVDLAQGRYPDSGSLTDAMRLAEVCAAGFASLRVELPSPARASSIWTSDMEFELFSYLRRYPAGLFDLTPRRFEELIAAIFRNNGFSVELTPQTRDGGVDIIAVQHSVFTGDTIHLVECKRYQPSNRVGIGVVQRLIGAVTQRRANKGILVATSSFTRDAIRVAEETRHVITLNDYNSIVGWLHGHDAQ